MLTLYSSGQKFLEYKFWKNCGKVIYDYSLNGRHAIYGLSLTDTTRDSTFTDRGLYMEPQKTVTLPPNSLASSFVLSDPVTILFWISMADQVGQIFVSYCASYLLGIHRDNSLRFHLWAFSGHYQKNTLTVRVNNYIHYNSALTSAINLSSACSNMNIGF